jgi:fructan beta-fructosidase
MEKEKAGRTDYQNQGIAYSTDGGKTWTKYEKNPVLRNHGIKDFRDPKVSWHEETKKWVMTLAVKDHIEFYGSTDLKTWSKLGDFGLTYGAHGGVWECPDLLQLPVNNTTEKKWVLIVSINPGGPNGGSATQYFVGDFDGDTFTCDSGPSKTSWVDYGPDNYAGVTWSNAPDERKIFLGWMSNWAYATQVPTSPWRSAMTVPRDISLTKVNDGYLFTSQVARELRQRIDNSKKIDITSISDSLDITKSVDFNISTSLITGRVEASDFYLELANEKKQMVRVGYDAQNNRFYIDRRLSGKSTFSPEFFGQAFAPRLVNKDMVNFTMVVDVSSVEVFFDDGTSVMSALVFPDVEYQTLSINAPGTLRVQELEIGHIPSVWANRRQQE